MLSVLLIDDEPALLDMIRIMSERSHEMTVETARSAKAGLEILQDRSFDAIIVDYDMPEISGIEFLKTLRSKGDSTPVIIFTGAGSEQIAIEALNNGATFFLEKGLDPRVQFREMVAMTRRAVDQKFIGRSPGTTQRIIADIINFSSEPGFAIDREGNVIAWNDSIVKLAGIPESQIIGKGDYAYAEPFFGTRQKMLADLVFATDDEIRKSLYMVISRVTKGTIIAVSRGQKKDGSSWTIWEKAKPIYDGYGNFIAVVSSLRDVTTTFGDVPLHDVPDCEPVAPGCNEATGPYDVTAAVPIPEKGSTKKTLARALSYYKEGVRLYVRENNFTGAIAAFDHALEIDEKLPNAWNDRGICYRELGDYTSALKSHLRAVELAPETPEFLFNLGETLELIGVLNRSDRYLDSAIQTFRMVADLLPNNAGTWNHLGICHEEKGKTEESKFFFDRARDIKLRNKDTPILHKCDEFL